MKSNQIHPTAILIGDIEMGFGNFIGPGCIIYGPITIGNDNYFGAYSSIGAPAEDESLSLQDHILMSSGGKVGLSSIKIGNGNIVREFVTINRGVTGTTVVEDETYLMTKSHIGHDSKILSQVKITSLVQIGGYSTIGFGANIGLSTSVHQWSVVGAYCMVGMNSSVTRDIPPGSLALGSPAKVVKPNYFSLEKIGINHFEWWEKYLIDHQLEDLPSGIQAHVQFFYAEVASKLTEKELVKIWRRERIKKI